MSKKNLLSESQVRHFMKLAKLEPLTPGFVNGLLERGGKAGDEDDEPGEEGRKDYTAKKEKSVKEVRTGTDPTPNLGTARRGHGRGRGGQDRLEEVAPEEELELDAADDLAGGSPEEDEEADVDLETAEDEELGDLGEPGADEGGGRMVSVDDFLASLESALEEFLGDEVEMDTSEMEDEEEGDVEDEVELDAELAPALGGEEELGAEDELELEEGVFGGGDKYEKLAKGKKDSYAPDPEEGEEEWKGSAPGESKRLRPRVRGHATGGGGMKIGGITAEGQDDLVEQLTKRVAARILKSALSKK